jgi:hypothetical protein
MTIKILSFLLPLLLFLISSPVLAVETCPPGENRYREGGECEKESPFIHSTISEYPVTCQNTPSVTYHRVSRTPPPNPDIAIVLVESDISKLELGGFGPSLEAQLSKSPDALAALYPFNALFDKPPNTSPFNERESFRTYWRLLSSIQQANAKAIYLREANQNKINNQTFKFYNQLDIEKEWTLKELYGKLPGCLKNYPVCRDYASNYKNLNQNTKDAYEALMPFNFDNLRGYEVIKYNPPGGGETVTHIMTENLPFVAAINQGLLSPQTGLLNTLSSDWTNLVRKEYLTSKSVIKKEQELSLVGQIESKARIAKCGNTPNGIYLPAPLTFPKGLDNPGNTLEQTFEIPIITEVEIRYTPLGNPYKVYISNGSGEGTTSVQVFNNPKQKDISLAISENQETSLFNMFTTAASQTPYQDRDINADLSHRTGHPVEPPSGSVGVGEPDTFAARKGGEPHVKLCELRNKWFIPASLQRNINCENLDQSLSQSNPIITPEPRSCDAKQHLFENSCNGELCYKAILKQTLSSSSCNGQVLNPYYAMAITLNENGGLVSGDESGTSAKHFGCDPFGAAGVEETVEGKLSCMINTLKNKCEAGLSQEENLENYGYEPGNNLGNLVGILEGPSNPDLFVSPSQAAQAASDLETLLPTQQDLWGYYFSGYIDNYCATHP